MSENVCSGGVSCSRLRCFYWDSEKGNNPLNTQKNAVYPKPQSDQSMPKISVLTSQLC